MRDLVTENHHLSKNQMLDTKQRSNDYKQNCVGSRIGGETPKL